MLNQYVQAFQRKDLAAIVKLFSPEILFQDPSFGLIRGRDNVLNAYKEIFKNDILSIDVVRQWQEGNLHIVEFLLVLKDVNGKRIVIEGIDLIETNLTHITSIRAYLDTSEFIQNKSSVHSHG